MEEQAKILNQEFHGNFTYDNQQMLQLDMQNFVVQLNNLQASKNINATLSRQQDHFFWNAVKVLYPQAIADYKARQDENYPFNGYGAAQNYEITYNQNCFLSTYYDSYEFTGSAHGNTIRRSSTFRLSNGTLVPLSYFVNGNFKVVTNEILKQAKQNAQSDPNSYFENYEQNIIKFFNPNSYYITQEGIVIYYQQYDIAPYAAGIIEFTIPYNLIANPPKCQISNK